MEDFCADKSTPGMHRLILALYTDLAIRRTSDYINMCVNLVLKIQMDFICKFHLNLRILLLKAYVVTVLLNMLQSVDYMCIQIIVSIFL